MMINTLIIILLILPICYSLYTKENIKLKILLIILSLIFILIFSFFLIGKDIFFIATENSNKNFNILLVGYNMMFIIIFSIYVIRELKILKENLTKVSRSLAIKNYKIKQKSN
jgi:prepilin signal peptidase PulO-like enzyme (type II secretory pathway)